MEKLLKFPLNDQTGYVLPPSSIYLLRSDFYKELSSIIFNKFDRILSIKELETCQFIHFFDEFKSDFKFVFQALNIPFPNEDNFKSSNIFFEGCSFEKFA